MLNYYMTDVFIRKLETFSPLSEDDKGFIASVTRRFDLVATETDIIREGDEPGDVRLIETGLGFRYKLLQRGKRQIVGYLFPGDICDLHASMLKAMDHSIAAISPSRVVRISRKDISALLARPAVARALLMVTLVNESIGRDWLANLGGRRAEQRLAHLFCEWHARMQFVGLTEANECEFPLTQRQVGETLGMTSIHVNRSLQSLRAEKLIILHHKRLTILDEARLRNLGGYEAAYMHIRSATLRPSGDTLGD